MIKGVNKKVVEINNPDSIYFEKAVFYIKPNINCLPQKLVRLEADRFINSLSPRTPRILSIAKVFLRLSVAISAISIAVMFFITNFM